MHSNNRTKNLLIVVAVCFVLGFMIAMASGAVVRMLMNPCDCVEYSNNK